MESFIDFQKSAQNWNVPKYYGLSGFRTEKDIILGIVREKINKSFLASKHKLKSKFQISNLTKQFI